MKRVVTLLLPLLLFAQPEFFGYFETEASTMRLGVRSYTFGFNKFRLDVEARPNEHIQVGANINIQNYWGKTTWNVFDFIPGYSESNLALNVNLPDTLLLDNVYLKLSFSLFDFTVGRQQLSPGVGYAWNPTDIFNSKSLLDPSYEQTGVEALRLDIPLGDRSSLIAIVQPQADLNHSTQQVLLKSGFGNFDFTATTSYEAKPDDGSTILGSDIIRERRMVGVSTIGEFVGWGVWGELVYNILDTDTNVPSGYSSSYDANDDIHPSEYVLGLDHTFDNSIYFLAEYLHNDIGVARQEDLSLGDFITSLSGETHSLMQDYAFFYAMHPTFDYVTLSALAFANFNDGSGVFSPIVDWNIFEDTNLSIQGSLSWGADNTEFGLQDWGLTLNVTSNF